LTAGVFYGQHLTWQLHTSVIFFGVFKTLPILNVF